MGEAPEPEPWVPRVGDLVRYEGRSLPRRVVHVHEGQAWIDEEGAEWWHRVVPLSSLRPWTERDDERRVGSMTAEPSKARPVSLSDGLDDLVARVVGSDGDDEDRADVWLLIARWATFRATACLTETP